MLTVQDVIDRLRMFNPTARVCVHSHDNARIDVVGDHVSIVGFHDAEELEDDGRRLMYSEERWGAVGSRAVSLGTELNRMDGKNPR
jgi:hypothetical protein